MRWLLFFLRGIEGRRWDYRPLRIYKRIQRHRSIAVQYGIWPLVDVRSLGNAVGAGRKTESISVPLAQVQRQRATSREHVGIYLVRETLRVAKVSLLIAFPLIAEIWMQPACGSEPAALNSPTVLIDVNNLSPKASAAVVSRIAGFSTPQTSIPYFVRRGDTLYSIIANRYRFSDGRYPETAAALASLVVRENALVNPRKLQEGQVLDLPLLPTRPLTKGARSDLSQALDLERGELGLVKRDIVDDSPISLSGQARLQDGATWHLRVTKEQLRELVDALPEGERVAALNDSFYIGPYRSIGYLIPLSNLRSTAGDQADSGQHPSDAETVTSVLTSPAQETAASMINTSTWREIKDDDVGELYLLDFFSHPEICTHGQLVRDKVSSVLHEIGQDGLMRHVQSVELDFFADKAHALSEIQTYLKSLGSRIYDAMQPTYQWLVSLGRPPQAEGQSGTPVPLIYLQALYGNRVSDQRASAVSSSFYVNYDGYEILPNRYDISSSVPLVSAVLDDPNSHIEDVISFEPQLSFRRANRDFGLVLVGAVDGNGNIIGMTSSQGDGVTAVADGRVSGVTGACSGVARDGTSFAAPAIAAYLMLSQALLKGNGEHPSAHDLKRRLLVSSDPDPSLVNRYASGGIPSSVRLLRPSGSYGIANDGTITALPEAEGASYIDVHSSLGLPKRLVFRRSTDGFSGLVIKSGRAYIFQEASLRWDEVQIDAIHFVIAGSPVDSMMDFSNKLKGVFLL